ncbi:hypothetical protein B0I35DRAFT_493086 [Stachybotrys elegans]|uniref:Uncharacterized protein n=1 Tax=Stachybotrys elegans TaxID=80388 RepID=A0A8K0SFP0_9HYPO|nr:hypothetical protein B0I35DRAFT_493086 [Stachybotrys elegans]
MARPLRRINVAEADISAPWKILLEPTGLGETEYRLLHFYASRTASALDGHFQDDLWRSLVLQSSTRVGQLRWHGLQYYGKAINMLNQHISSNKWAYLEETLLCCVLCIKFEWIAGNRTKALVHLRSSIQILREWQASSTSPFSSSTSFWSPGGYMIRSTLSPLYVRLSLEASMFAKKKEAVPIPPKPLLQPAIKDFVTLKDARDSLYDILGDEFLFRKQPGGLHTASDQQPTTTERFSQWSLSLKGLLQGLGSPLNSTPAAVTLRIWLRIVKVMLEVSGMGYDECVFDQYTQDFSDAVDLAALIYSEDASAFLADTSVVAVLFYVATKCRHPQIRRRAVSLLESSSRQEGIWHSALAVQMATKIIELEENAVGGEVSSETDIPPDVRLLARIYVWEDW